MRAALLRRIELVGSWSGKAFVWLVVVLTLAVAVEVLKRYILNAPTAWMGDFTAVVYVTLLMMCGPCTLALSRPLRVELVFRGVRPRIQAAIDLALYLSLLVPGALALVSAAHRHEHAAPPPTWEHTYVRSLEAIILVAAALALLQGIAEIVRCISCLRSGAWRGDRSRADVPRGGFHPPIQRPGRGDSQNSLVKAAK